MGMEKCGKMCENVEKCVKMCWRPVFYILLLFTPDPAEYSNNLNLTIDHTIQPTTNNPKILGLTLDTKLTYNEHIKQTKAKADKTIKILKELTSTHWGKSKETLSNTYKTVTRPILEYGRTISLDRH